MPHTRGLPKTVHVNSTVLTECCNRSFQVDLASCENHVRSTIPCQSDKVDISNAVLSVSETIHLSESVIVGSIYKAASDLSGSRHMINQEGLQQNTEILKTVSLDRNHVDITMEIDIFCQKRTVHEVISPSRCSSAIPQKKYAKQFRHGPMCHGQPAGVVHSLIKPRIHQDNLKSVREGQQGLCLQTNCWVAMNGPIVPLLVKNGHYLVMLKLYE